MDMKPGNLLRKLMAGAAALTVMLQASVNPARADDELAFWVALTPETRDLPVRLQVQPTEREQPTSGHLDLACSDRTLVRAWHERNGATVVAEHPQWTVMRDPAGGVYCLTSRDV